MLDIKLIRERPDFVRQRLATRGAGDEVRIDEVLKCDERLRALVKEHQELKTEHNRVSKGFGDALARKKQAEWLIQQRGSKSEQAIVNGTPEIIISQKKEEMRKLGDRIVELAKQAAEAETARNQAMLRLPNLPHESVPVGKSAEDNPVVRVQGEKPAFAFKPKSHVELCKSLGLVDFDRAVKLAGSGFLLYTNWGAKLERALIQFMLDLHTTEHGYTEVSPPFMVGPQCLEGVGQFPKFADQYYAVQEGLDASTLGKLYLIPTAETPVANIHREELLSERQLPICYCAYTPCFRGEAGAAGVGTRGMIRVHQFDKVELIRIVKPEDSYAEQEKMVAHAERVLQTLGLHYRMVLLCTGDMGFASARTYDLEVWAPGQGSYLEVSSVSNCEDFQSRRMNLRFKNETGENRFPHLLNGSGTALARLFVALVETYQQADGSLVIPPALQPYLKTEWIQA
jgi:seryl-tRNA synthetase